MTMANPDASQKYGRSLHAPISLGTTSDDRFMPPGYLASFADEALVLTDHAAAPGSGGATGTPVPGEKLDGHANAVSGPASFYDRTLVLTEKLDGQNNCLSRLGLFARSHAAPSALPWDRPLRARWERIRDDLGDWEIFGENLYGVHSIAYTRLESFFYVFAVRQRGRWLSWEEVKFIAALFDFPTVPEIPITTPLAPVLQAARSEDEALRRWLHLNLGLDWTDYVQTAGQLGGQDPRSGAPACEGLVLRRARSFRQNEGLIAVQPNEFDSLFKLVRAKHIKTDEHWTRHWRPAKLIDYQRYHWEALQYE